MKKSELKQIIREEAKKLFYDTVVKEELKWKKDSPSGEFVYISYPHLKVGSKVSGKTKEIWEKRLSNLFGTRINLDSVKKFYDPYMLDFEFILNNNKYRVAQVGESSTSAKYVIQKKPIHEAIIKIREEKIEGQNELSHEIRSKIILFIKDNPNLDDTKFHNFVEGLGVDPHEAEEVVYNELHKRLTTENKK